MSLHKDLKCFTRMNLSDHNLRTSASVLQQFLGLGNTGYQPLIQSNKRGSSPEISSCEYEYLLHRSVCTQHRSPHNPAGTGHQRNQHLELGKQNIHVHEAEHILSYFF